MMRFCFRFGRSNRIKEQLETDFWCAGIARQYANDSRQIGTGTVAANRNTRGVSIDFGRMFCNPVQRSFAIVDRSRKLALRRESVIDRDDDTISLVRQRAANGIVCVEITDDIPATVIPDKDRQFLS